MIFVIVPYYSTFGLYYSLMRTVQMYKGTLLSIMLLILYMQLCLMLIDQISVWLQKFHPIGPINFSNFVGLVLVYALSLPLLLFAMSLILIFPVTLVVLFYASESKQQSLFGYYY